MWQRIWQGLYGFISWLFNRVYDGAVYLYGFDLDSLPFDATKDGYSPFPALAGFAVAQSVALTAVVRGDRNKGLVLTIYTVTVLVTLFWISWLLRSELRKEDQPLPDKMDEAKSDLRHDRLRAYDRTSISYGRWTLNWIVLVTVIMLTLGVKNLLPNQTTRVEYAKFPIECTSMSISARQGLWSPIGGTKLERAYMDVWQKWLAQAKLDDPAKQRLIWIEQKGKFNENHMSFTGRLACDSNLAIKGRAAFLVKADRSSPRPVYRQMAFRIENALETNTIYLDEPNEQEFLVILAIVEGKNQEGQKLIESDGPYAVWIEESK